MIAYKGFRIEPRPDSLLAGGYSLNVTILSFEDHQVTAYQCSTNNEYPDKATAVWHCLNFARLVIDGQIPNCSVA